MSGNNSSRSSKIMVPEAKAAMDKFKMEAAGEVGEEGLQRLPHLQGGRLHRRPDGEEDVPQTNSRIHTGGQDEDGA